MSEVPLAGRHVIFVDVDTDDEDEVRQMGRQASIVTPGGMRTAVVLDALDEADVELLLSGHAAWLRYDEQRALYGAVDYSLLVCVHPPRGLDLRDTERRRIVLERHVVPAHAQPLPLPVAQEWVSKAARRGGGRLHIDLDRLEAQVRLDVDMAERLLAGEHVAVTGADSHELISSHPGPYELFVPRRGRPGEVAYRRLH
jgi:hypothetical protein